MNCDLEYVATRNSCLANPDKQAHFRYEGFYKDDLKAYRGRYTHADGTMYTGEYKLGKPSGRGVYEYPTGKITLTLHFSLFTNLFSSAQTKRTPTVSCKWEFDLGTLLRLLVITLAF